MCVSKKVGRGEGGREGGREGGNLIHKLRNHTVEVKAVVEPRVGKVDEVVGSDGHLLREELHRKGAGKKRGGWGG